MRGHICVIPPKLEQSVSLENTANRDRSLQIARRVDWRFLLPKPQLGCVAYLGPQNTPLFEALAQFSQAPPHLIARQDVTSPCDTPFDLVVVCSQRTVDVQQACALLRSDGHLYWEIDRLHGLLSLASLNIRQTRCRLHLLLHPHLFLEHLGFRTITMYWHYPTFEDCREIIPLNTREALTYVFARKREKLAHRIAWAAGRLLLHIRLLPRLVPYVSIVASKE